MTVTRLEVSMQIDDQPVKIGLMTSHRYEKETSRTITKDTTQAIVTLSNRLDVPRIRP